VNGPGAPAPARLSFLRQNAPWLSAGGLLAFSSSYGQTYFISVFAGAIMAEFALSDGDWGAIYGAGTLASALLVALTGGLLDRYRVRALGTAILALVAGACLFMAWTPAAWALIPAILFLRYAGQGMTSLLASTAMARWFVASRGRALAIATMGFALGESLLPIAFVAALSVAPWRSLWVLAAAMALAAIPLLRLLLHRERVPRGGAAGDDSAGLQGRHWTRGQAVRHPLFWAAVPLILGPSACVTALFFQQVHLAAQKGWAHVEFVALFPVYTATSITAMLATGWLIDRFGTGRLLPVFQLPIAAGFVLMGMAESLTAGALAMALTALSMGAYGPLSTAFWAEYFGTRHLGAIRALAAAIMVLGSAIGPVVSGGLIDAGLPFDRQMLAMAGWFLATSALIGFGLARWGGRRRESA
jgi:MFS family permease